MAFTETLTAILALDSSQFVSGIRRAADVVGDFLKDASRQAADFEETLGKFNVVFGRFSKDARSWAEEFSESIGRGRAATVRAMADFQGFTSALGFSREKSMEVSKALTQLSADLATFTNQTDAEAVRDLMATLSGSHEVARKYGAAISEATIEQEAFNLGIGRGFKDLAENEKVLARLNILIRSTADAHGNAAREAETLNGKMRRFQGIVSDLHVEMGTKLNEAIVSAIDRMGGFQKAEEILRAVMDAAVELGRAAIDVGVRAAQAAVGWIESMGGVEAMHLRLLAAVEGVKAGWQVLEAVGLIFAKTTQAAFMTVRDAVVSVGSVAIKVAGTIHDQVVKAIEILAEKAATALHFLKLATPGDLGIKFGEWAEGLDNVAKAADRIKSEELLRTFREFVQQESGFRSFGDALRQTGNELELFFKDRFGITMDDVRTRFDEAGRSVERMQALWGDAAAAAASYADRAREAADATRQVGTGAIGTFSIEDFERQREDARFGIVMGGEFLTPEEASARARRAVEEVSAAQERASSTVRSSVDAVSFSTFDAGEAFDDAFSRGVRGARGLTDAVVGSTFAVDELSRAIYAIPNFPGVPTEELARFRQNLAFAFPTGILPTAGQQQGIFASFEDLLRQFQGPGFARGGEVDGPSGFDAVPARLTRGEFVVNRESARANRELLQSINAGRGRRAAPTTINVNLSFPNMRELNEEEVERRLLPIFRRLARRGAM